MAGIEENVSEQETAQETALVSTSEAIKEEKPEEATLPKYTFPYSQDSRNSLMKEMNFTPDMMKVFNKVCLYAAHPQVNSAVLNIDRFLVFSSGRDDLKGLQRQAVLGPLYNLIKLVKKEDLGIVEVLAEDEEGNPSQILLKERQSEVYQLYRYVADFFETSYRDFLEKTGILLSKEDALRGLSITEVQFESLLQQVDSSTLTLAKIEELSNSGQPLTLFSCNDFIPNVIIPTNRLPKIVEIFVKFLNNYYEDDLNEDIRHHVLKKVREQKLDTRRLTRVIKEGIIGDAYFLFFSQLFYNVMLSVMDKISQQNFQNKEIYNQCFMAFFLSRISVNERNLLVEKKRGEDVIKEHYLAVVQGLIGHSVMHRGSKAYMPFNITTLLELESELFSTESGSKIIRLSEVYNEKSLSELIRKKNYKGNTIENILVFSSNHVKYYCHRVRLITAFLSVLTSERETIEQTIHQDWVNDINSIVDKDKEHEFIELLETKYISSFFKNFLNLALKIIHSSVSGGPKIDFPNLVQRLFFTEEDKLFITAEARDLVYKSEDLEKKKYILEKFYDVLIDPKTGQDRRPHEILDLSFSTIRTAAIKGSKIGWFKRIRFSIKEFFSGIVLFFEGDKNYLSFLSRRYYNFAGRGQSSFSSKSSKKSSNASSEPSLASETNAEAGKPKRGVKSRAMSSGSSATNEESRKSDKKAKLKLLLKNVPDLKDTAKINSYIEKEHDIWNIKIGDVRLQLRESVDSRIESMASRFEASAFVKKNMELFYNKITSSIKLDGIGDKKALQNYIFYKAALIHYSRMK